MGECRRGDLVRGSLRISAARAVGSMVIPWRAVGGDSRRNARKGTGRFSGSRDVLSHPKGCLQLEHPSCKGWRGFTAYVVMNLGTINGQQPR
jgi:hypothetical protein